LDNANKYSPAAPDIRVATKDHSGSLIVEISDRGIGIAAEDQKRVFEKYFRVHTGNLHDVKGFGLGLSYVKLITEAHGGDVTLESTPGQGTTVRLRLPLSLGDAR
jgi:two-component system phosphate regulon sensor histidine kinase PhoR